MNLSEYSQYLRQNSNHFQKIIEQCRNILTYFPIAKEAREYVDQRISKSNQEKFSLGYFPDNDNLNLLTDIIGFEPLRKTKLLYSRNIAEGDCIIKTQETILTRHNLIMPYHDLYGNTISIVGRTLLPKEQFKLLGIGKYKNSPFSKNLHLFGLDCAKRAIISSGFVIIVEGQIDLISCRSKGIFNVVALGGSAFSKYHLQILKRYTNKICLLLDNDEAGEKAVAKILNKFANEAKFLVLHPPKEFNDVDEYLRKGTNLNIFNHVGFT